MANQLELNQDKHNEFEFDYLKVEKLSSDVLNTFADELPKDWIKLARFLKITNDEIDKVLHEYKTAREQIFEIFNSWCEKNPDKTWSDLKSGLIFCERNDVIIKCERKLIVSSIFGVQPPSGMLFLRNKELCEIHSYFIELQDEKKATLVLYGMSGVGKTQLARKYCKTYHNFYENFVWIDAAFGNLQTSLYNILQKLGFIVQNSKGDYIAIEVVVEKVHNYYKNEKTLYIFDNVDDESVRYLEMYISKKPNAFTLITSQWRTWSNNVNKMFIDVFSSEEAFAYVKNNIKENTDENIRKLIKELGYHPFAINQAIKYINIHNILIEKYIERYKSKPLEILDDDNFPTEEESKSAIKAINLVLIKMEKTKTFPLQIINFLSHCDGKHISKEFIIQISKHIALNEEYLVDEAIRLLMSYSLLDCFDNEKYTMHDLTQLSCRYFQIKNSNTNMYLDLIENYFKFELNEVKVHVGCGNHFVYHFLHMFRINRKRMSKTFHSMTTSIKKILFCNCLFLEALEILKAVQSFNAETYGVNNNFTLDTNLNIASCLYEMGKYNETLEIYYSVDKIRTEFLGINHPFTLTTKHNIAECLCQMGKYNEALEIYYSVDKIRTNILGIDHPDTMTTKNNIAVCYHNMGKYNEALKKYYFVDKRQTEILGTSHPSTMTTKNNIAECLREMRKYNEALEIYCSIDKIQAVTISNNHPSRLITKNNIALCLDNMGKYNEALEVYYSVNKMQTEILGINHPSTLTTKSNIALCLYNMGKYNEALEINYSVDKIRCEIFGINHPSTMTTKNNIAECLRKMGKYNEALEINYSVVKIRSEILGINHPYTLTTKSNIALCLYNMGKYNEALEINYSVDKIRCEIFGINHPYTMRTKNNIAECLCKMEKYNEALKIFYSVDKIQTETFGSNHPYTIRTKNNIANCLRKLNHFNQQVD
ncbi:uncharacterized protein LOC105844028 isoform X1 [Hydra vulgaris]|uniref:uncharacterized protein LOC105844028 isoform X1 n=1 Tax=Hydra vulgaris TaxID=6087 RepID=UPI001F5FDE02|nr:uncharacterized protein LOC105844028 [Hydra vulgaris]XP_047137232.1 uncharacterized protein LOC105844028 [Hydra vulgaris]